MAPMKGSLGLSSVASRRRASEGLVSGEGECEGRGGLVAGGLGVEEGPFLRWLRRWPAGGRKAHCQLRLHTSRSGKDLPSVILRMCANGVNYHTDSSWKARK